MKTYYELLSVAPTAPPDEIKRAFRREIARYHPDKVQHLGPEFQEIASTRAAELTEAYRILMDVEARQRYDSGLEDGTIGRVVPAATPTPAAAPARAPAASSEPAEPRAREREVQDRATLNEFVRRAILARLRDGAVALTGSAVTVQAPGFDVGYVLKSKGGLFKKADPSVRLLVRVVPQATGAAVEETWPLAVKAAGNETGCVLLLGASGMAEAKELSAAVTSQRRKSRGSGPVVIPVDVRDWEALLPPDTPQIVRTLLEWLRQGRS